MAPNPEPLARLFGAARDAQTSPETQAPVSLKRELLRQLRQTECEENTLSLRHQWETLSAAAIPVGGLIAIACTLAAKSLDPSKSTFDAPNRIASEFIQQSIEP